MVFGVGADALGLSGEVVLGPVGVGVGEGVGLAGEAGGAGAVGDPGGEAVVVGEVEELFGGDAHAGAGVGVVADHGGVDGHRDPGGLLGVVGVAHAEQEAALEEVEDAFADLLGVAGSGAELREVLDAARHFQAGAAVGGDLVDEVLGVGDVVGFVDDHRHPGSLVLGEGDLALHLAVQHAQHEQEHGFDVVVADLSLGAVDDQDVAGLDDLADGDVGGVVQEPADRRGLQEGGDLVARRVHPHGRLRGREA